MEGQNQTNAPTSPMATPTHASIQSTQPTPPAPVAPPQPVITPTNTKSNKSKKTSAGMMAAVIILAIASISGIAFGIIELMESSQKDSTIAMLNNKVANCANQNNNTNNSSNNTDNTTCPDSTTIETTTTIDNTTAQTIIGPYIDTFSTFTNLLDYDLNIDAKLTVALHNVGVEKAKTVEHTNGLAITVDYYNLNSKYQYLFGTDQAIEKRNYTTPFDGYEYISDTDSFKISLGGIGGTGGTQFSVAKNAYYKDNSLIIEVYHGVAPWCGDDDQPDKDQCVEAYSFKDSKNVNDYIRLYADNIPVYIMTFSENGGHYVLRSVQKQ